MHSGRRQRTGLFVSVLISLLAFSCAGGLGLNLFPESKDIELGKEIDTEIRKNPKEYPVLSNRPEIKHYVESIGRDILGSPEVKKREMYAYQFEIIHDDSTINAFCTPGGYIYVYTGLLKFVDDEATLAGVLGHEVAHAERRHATRRMTSALGVQLLLAVVLGKNPGQVAQIAGNLFGGLALLKNGRDDEIEADTYSIKYLQSTEYYPGAIKFFFEKISNARGRTNALEKFLSTHPLPEERIENVDKLMKDLNVSLEESGLFRDRFGEMQRRLP